MPRHAYAIIPIGLLIGYSAAAAAAQPSPFPPGYDEAYRSFVAALPEDARAMPWLVRLNGVTSPPRDLVIGSKPVLYLFACKNHECDTNNANIFLAPDHRKVIAVVRINGVRALIGGAGRLEIACVAKLDASGGVATTC